MAERTNGGEVSREPNQDNHSHRIVDPAEAERMARAMHPHYEQASQIDQISLDTDELATEERRQDSASLGGENSDLTGTAKKEVLEDEAAAWVEREVSVEDQRRALDAGAEAARKAGDAAGDQAPIAYRQEREQPTDAP